MVEHASIIPAIMYTHVYVYIYIYIHIYYIYKECLCTYIQAELNLIILVILESSIYDEGVVCAPLIIECVKLMTGKSVRQVLLPCVKNLLAQD